MSDLVLMTGASGFLGRRLLRAWLQGTSTRLVACVRPRNGRTPAERLSPAIASEDQALREAYRTRVYVLPSDLASPGLGLDPAVREELATSVTHIVHCGGVVRFDLPLEVARRTNTEGTAALLDLAHRCVGLRRFDHISTAFVAGRREGPVNENELDCGQEFRNSYEQSKFEAERLVRDAMSGLPIAIHRPSIVTCDRRTGELSALGAVARLLRAYAMGLLTHLPGKAEARLDLVPADFVSDAVFAIAQDEDTLGRCFHLAAGEERSATLGEVRDLAAAGFARPPLSFSEDGGGGQGAGRPRIRKELSLYAPYLDGGSRFSVKEATAALEGTEIQVPALRDYFGDLVRGVVQLGRGGLGGGRP